LQPPHPFFALEYNEMAATREVEDFVWAPHAKSAQLNVDGKRIRLEQKASGWWAGTHTLRHGDDYTFDVNDKRSLPDPRSPWQPEGAHGPSGHVDHSNYGWRDDAWTGRNLDEAVFYELHIGTFTSGGTFESAIDKLDHLCELGITHIELMPIAEFAGSRGWGYDGVDLFAPHHAYGGPHGVKQFVDASHACGLSVILDVVYNHLGPSGNNLADFGPYFSERYLTPWGPALNFDGPYSDEVRRFFCDNAIMWLRDYHFDGLRIDSVHEIADRSALPFLEQLAREVKRLQEEFARPLILIGEEGDNGIWAIRPWSVGGLGFDAQWSNDIHHSLHALLTGERVGHFQDYGRYADLAKAMQEPFVYDGPLFHQPQTNVRSTGQRPIRTEVGRLFAKPRPDGQPSAW
jgi:maltooligosyltrehalose trehalohydrolase